MGIMFGHRKEYEPKEFSERDSNIARRLEAFADHPIVPMSLGTIALKIADAMPSNGVLWRAYYRQQLRAETKEAEREHRRMQRKLDEAPGKAVLEAERIVESAWPKLAQDVFVEKKQANSTLAEAAKIVDEAGEQIEDELGADNAQPLFNKDEA